VYFLLIQCWQTIEPRNLSISYRFSSWLEYRFLKSYLKNMILWISSEYFYDIPFSPPIYIYNFYILHLSFVKFCLVFVNLVYFFKESALCFKDSLYHSFSLFFINFFSEFYYFFILTNFGFGLFLFSKSLRYIIRLFEISLIS
jgi:hypothetical protein